MRYTPIVMIMFAVEAAADPTSYSNPAVVENPTGPSTQVLLYPGGQYGRIVQNDLLEPGEDSGPIALHRPGHQPARHVIKNQAAIRQEAPVATKLARPEPPPAKAIQPPKLASLPPNPPPVVRKPEPVAPKAFEKSQTKHAVPPSDVGDYVIAKPIVTPPVKPPEKIAPPPKPPEKVARLTPAKASAPESFGVRRGSISFERNATDPGSATLQSVGKLADSLSGALSGGASRVQILSYAGPRGDKSSDSRRLSLKRALIVRQLLIDGGVPSDRIDVRAMGGASDNGASDRVDLFLKG